MAKLTAWLVTLLGVILLLGLFGLGFDWTTMWVQWLIALIVLVIGIAKLIIHIFVDAAEVEGAFTALTSGAGYYLIKGGFSAELTKRTRDLTLHLVHTENSKATHFTGRSCSLI